MAKSTKSDKKIARELLAKIRKSYSKEYSDIKKSLTKIMLKIGTPGEDPLDNYRKANLDGRLQALINFSTNKIYEANEKVKGTIDQSNVAMYKINRVAEIEALELQVGKSLGLNRFGDRQIKALLDRRVEPFQKLAYQKLDNRSVLKQSLTNSLTRGIMDGDTIPMMANRIKEITNKDYKKAERIARTEVMGVRNAAKQDVSKELEESGIKTIKRWVSFIDSKTRESHVDMDGEEVASDERFSNGLMYPGDQSGAPEEVINCRCTMITIITEVSQFTEEEEKEKVVDFIDESGVAKPNEKELEIIQDYTYGQRSKLINNMMRNNIDELDPKLFELYKRVPFYEWDGIRDMKPLSKEFIEEELKKPEKDRDDRVNKRYLNYMDEPFTAKDMDIFGTLMSDAKNTVGTAEHDDYERIQFMFEKCLAIKNDMGAIVDKAEFDGNVELYRGTTEKELSADLKVGDTFEKNHFLSFSKNKGIAEEFAKSSAMFDNRKEVFFILEPQDKIKDALFIGEKSIGENAVQEEVLLKHKKFEIVDKKVENNRITYRIREIKTKR